MLLVGFVATFEVYGFHEDEAKWQLGAIEDKDALRRKLLQTCQVLEKVLRSVQRLLTRRWRCLRRFLGLLFLLHLAQTVKSLQMGNWPAPIVQLATRLILTFVRPIHEDRNSRRQNFESHCHGTPPEAEGEQQLLKMEEFQILLLSVDHPHHEPDESDHDRTE